MNGYLLTIIGTVLISSVFTAILPEGKTANTVKGIAKLVCLLVIISPVLNFLQKGTESGKNSQTFFSETGIQTDESFIKYYSEMRIRNAETLLEEELYENFSIETEVALQWKYDTEDGTYDVEKIRITQVQVVVPQETEKEARTNMWEYLSKNYCSEVLIE